MKIAVYTAIFGDKDRFRVPKRKKDTDWDFICFTDNESLNSSSDAMVVTREPLDPDPCRAAKAFKILPHLVLPEYDASIWVDGSIEYNAEKLHPETLVDLYIRKTGSSLALLRHPKRSCIYEEAEFCKGASLGEPDIIDMQMSKYREAGYPQNGGLYSGGFLVRLHHDPKCMEFCDAWWRVVRRYSKRDQLSFPPLAYLLQLNFSEIDSKHRQHVKVIDHVR